MTPMHVLAWIGVVLVGMLALGVGASVIASALKQFRKPPNPFAVCTRKHECMAPDAGPCNGLADPAKMVKLSPAAETAIIRSTPPR